MNQLPEDSELVKKLQTGDIKAFDIIYRKYSKGLSLFGYKYLKSVVETEELVQSVFLKVWDNHKHLNKDLSFKSYLFTIAYNEISNIFRKRNYMQKLINETHIHNSDLSFTTEQSIDFQSVLERVRQIVEKLPGKQRIVFQKSKYEGKTTKEIAKELRLSTGTVDNYISNALNFIRKHLETEDLPILLFFTLFFF